MKTNLNEIACQLDARCKMRGLPEFYAALQTKAPNFLDALGKNVEQVDFDEKDVAKVNFSLKGMIALALDFYKQFDAEIHDKILKVLLDERLIKNFSEPAEQLGANSVSVNVFERRDVAGGVCEHKVTRVLNLNPSNNWIGVFMVLHELGHMAEQDIQEGVVLKNNLNEIAPLFFEKVAGDFFENCGLIDAEQKAVLWKGRKKEFVANVHTLLEEKEFFEKVKMPITAEQFGALQKTMDGKSFQKLMKRAEIMLHGYGDARKYIDGKRQVLYVVGELAANLLYEDFQKNSHSALGRLKTFLSKSAADGNSAGLLQLLGEGFESRISASLGEKNSEKTK